MPKPLDLIGKTFSRLTVIKGEGRNKYGSTIWLCVCTCGKQKTVIGTELKNGIIKSCGCLQKEKVTNRNFKHGKRHLRLHTTWRNMKQRCSNPNRPDYKNYGGRGIAVCDEWANDFETFFIWSIENGYKDNLSIDRIDGTKSYYPENCRWATSKEQARNIRTNVIVDINGEQITLSEVAEKYQVNYDAVKMRYKKGLKGMDLITGLKKSI